MTESAYRRRLTEYEIQIQDLQAHARAMETEVVHLRKKLEEIPKDFVVLESKLREANRQLVQAFNQNEKLVNTLYEAREQISSLKEGGRQALRAPLELRRVPLAERRRHREHPVERAQGQGEPPPVDREGFDQPGQELVLNEGLNVIETAGYEIQGEVVIMKEALDEARAVVTVRADEEKVAVIAEPLRPAKLKVGDHLLMDSKSGYLLEKLPKSEVEDLALEEVPDIQYEDIGGLTSQIEAIRTRWSCRTSTPTTTASTSSPRPRASSSTARPGAEDDDRQGGREQPGGEGLGEARREDQGFFMNVKGPELLNKYVGETERKIREIFVKAKEKAAEDVPVVVFFDEMDALFRTRGSGISSDVETTIVPQLLAEIDGVEGLKNVIVIGASNRQDLIDPAILRPGRLDVKIKIDRPDRQAAGDIMAKYLTPDIPMHEQELGPHGDDISAAIVRLIEMAVDAMYTTGDENRFLEVTYANGDKEVLYFKDFASGAMMESVVRRAKKLALKRYIGSGEKGIKLDDLLAAVREEFKENEDLPNTTNPDDWAKIAGKKGERIVYVKPLTGESKDKHRPVERQTTGQYL